MAKRGASTDPTRADQGKYRSQIGEEVRAPLTKSRLAKLDEIIEEVPDENDPAQINYWVKLDDYDVYIEGWADECLAGTGFPTMERGGTQEKLNYMEDLTPGILERKAQERGLELVDGGFRELPDADNLYGVTWGVYRKHSSNPGIPTLREMIIAKTYPGANLDFARVTVFPIGSPTYPGRFCLFSSNENAYFGRLKDTFEEAVEAANKENMRMYGLISKGKEHHSWSTPRAIAAIATGALTGLVGSAVPVVGLAGGLLAQVFEKQTPQLLKAQHLTAGVVDGSAALLARSLFRSVQARPMKLTLTEEELDKLEFEAAKKGEYVPSPPRPTKEQFKEILREKLLKKD